MIVSNGACVECVNNFYFDQQQDKCIQVDPLCKTYEKANGNCLTCYTGYE